MAMKADFRIECDNCGEVFPVAIDVPEPDWVNVESQSDIWSESDTIVECPKCGSARYFWVINSAMQISLSAEDGTIDEFGVAEAYYPPEESDWIDLDWSPEGAKVDPHEYFLESMEGIRSLLKERAEPDGTSFLNRMLFVQIIVAMEAYLGDTLLKEVMSDEEALRRLLSDNSDLRTIKVSLLEVESSKDIVSEKIRKYLHDLLCHNIPKVSRIYATALEIDLPLDEPDKSKLLEAIQCRHDCVHRNGFTKEGEQLELFVPDYLKGVVELVKKFVNGTQRLIINRWEF